MIAWVSTGSELTGRASVMAYTSRDGELDAWYASFRRSATEWMLDRVKGTARAHVAHPRPDTRLTFAFVRSNDERRASRVMLIDLAAHLLCGRGSARPLDCVRSNLVHSAT